MKTIKNIILILFFSVPAYCQTGKLEVFLLFGEPVSYSTETRYILYKGDSLIQEDINECDYFEAEYLNPGNYNIEIYRGDRLITRYYDLEIKADSISDYNVALYEPYFYSISDTLSRNLFFEYYWGCLYNNTSFIEDEVFKRNFTLKLGIDGSILNYFEYLDLGILAGSELSYTKFKSDTSMYPIFDPDKERYINANINLGIYNRISFYSYEKKNWHSGFILDVGANYNFPILFRHVYMIDNQRVSTKKIHQYNNVSAFVRFSYLPISIVAEYRITDYLNNFPEEPRIKLGIIFLIMQ